MNHNYSIGDVVSIDTDNPEWGRVVGLAEVLDIGETSFLVQANTIRANILVPLEDINKPEDFEE